MSEIRPIRSEQDYEAALAEIGRLWARPVDRDDPALHEELGISAEVLIRPTRRAGAA